MREWIARCYLKLVGWRFEGAPPPTNKYIILGVPHTSNWDLPLLLSLGWMLGLRVSWLGKHTLFRPPFGGFMRCVGGVPVDRTSRHNVVQQVADEFRRRDYLILCVPPEGTRRRSDYWKSGFYYIALEAGVPIVPGKLDYGSKTGGLGEAIYPTGNVRADMDRIRAYYMGVTGKYPEHFGPIRLKQEDEAPVEENGVSAVPRDSSRR